MVWRLSFRILRTIRGSRYLLLLLALSTLLVAYPFWGRDVVGLATLDLVLWGVLLGGLWALHRDRRLLRVALVLAAAAILGDLVTYLYPSRQALLVSCLLDLALLLFVTVVVVTHVLEEGAVDADRIFGAICGYLLIGLTWALLYGALDLTQPGSFDLGEETAVQQVPSEEPAPHFADMDPFIYYSLVTLSTLGYGDIVALTRAARSLSALEAIVGQIYMAVVVARLIGLQILGHRRERI